MYILAAGYFLDQFFFTAAEIRKFLSKIMFENNNKKELFKIIEAISKKINVDKIAFNTDMNISNVFIN